VPVFVLFREDLIRMLRDPFEGEGPFWARPGVRWLLYVVVASVPTAIMGKLLEDTFERLFSSPLSLAWQFAVTAIALQLCARWRDGERDIGQMRWTDALLIGIAQGVAVLPAVSRSGATIVCAMALGLRRDLAGRFSFVISIPAILGAALLKLDDVDVDPAVLPAFAAGTAVALVVGGVSLWFLMKVIRGGDFSRFAWYCWAMVVACVLIGSGWF
jgi:undecaprenyl-diphosphatase